MLGLSRPLEKVFRHHGQVMDNPDPEPAHPSPWVPPILRTIATDGTGIAALVAAIEDHVQHLRKSGDWGRREKARLEAELEALLTETLVARFRSKVPDARYEKVIDQLVQRALSPWEAVKELLG
jgi:LAO/AO transport system kinase